MLCHAAADCCAVAAANDVVYVWQFRSKFTRQLASEQAAAGAAAAGVAAAAGASGGSAAAPVLQRKGRERMLHIDTPGNVQVGWEGDERLVLAACPHGPHTLPCRCIPQAWSALTARILVAKCKGVVVVIHVLPWWLTMTSPLHIATTILAARVVQVNTPPPSMHLRSPAGVELSWPTTVCVAPRRRRSSSN